ncbi:MAG: N-acetylmuramoyl-L-alanine amidase [Bacteroidaceae bacterium]|nr:N-acetylmuramoyl-L-alanine amidase [Bacteroidaceae bacterium]
MSRHYAEHQHPTPNFDPEKRNTVEGVILHHTAEPTVERSLEVLTSKKKGVGTHVVIDTDGTRYVMCAPEVVTFHAGKSVLNGRESCNEFTIGIEFQGNTLEAPLTDEQIYSAIEYLRPLIVQYHIPTANIVTHEMVRKAYKEKYPDARCYDKVDITPAEYEHFMRLFIEEMGDF